MTALQRHRIEKKLSMNKIYCCSALIVQRVDIREETTGPSRGASRNESVDDFWYVKKSKKSASLYSHLPKRDPKTWGASMNAFSRYTSYQTIHVAVLHNQISRVPLFNGSEFEDPI